MDDTTFRQEDIDDLFTDLKVLGQVRPCDRMATRGAQMRIDGESTLQPLWRWMQGESREATQRGIKRILSQVNAIIDLSMAVPPTDKRQILQRSIVRWRTRCAGWRTSRLRTKAI